jgi:uncharacterized iron-regulated membrane protein
MRFSWYSSFMFGLFLLALHAFLMLFEVIGGMILRLRFSRLRSLTKFWMDEDQDLRC